jgi:hypothetical protein
VTLEPEKNSAWLILQIWILPVPFDGLIVKWYYIRSINLHTRSKSMSLLACRMAPCQTLAPTLIIRQALGDKGGDIPLYSLHRIRRMMAKQPPTVSEQLRTWLTQNLIAANIEYKEATGNDWSCITGSGLVDAFDTTDSMINNAIDGIRDLPKEHAMLREKLLAKLHAGREENILTMKQWFESNFEQLQYSMDGKIPWPIVLQLRRNLGKWIAGASNPFDQDIEEMIMEVASQEGIQTESPEEAWERMGGKLFKSKEELL